MRLLWTFLVAGCVTTSGPPEGETPIANQAAPEQPAPQAVTPDQAIAGLTAKPAIAYYLPERNEVLYAQVVNVEGTSETVSVILIGADGMKDTAAEWDSMRNEDEGAAA